ncbi:MAG: TetR/AcrR family transcriptional regulator [Calditrichia bacterium]
MNLNGSRPEPDTRNRIFFTAAKLFAQEGFDRVSIRQICESVGVGKPTLYYYFKDKETLLNELITHSFMVGQELIQTYVLNKSDYLEQVFGIIKARQEYVKQYPHFIRFFLMLNIYSLPDGIREQMKSRAAGLFRQLIDFLEAGKQKMIIDPATDSELLAVTMIGTLNQLIFRHLYLSEKNLMSDENMEKLFQFWKQHLFLQPKSGA